MTQEEKQILLVDLCARLSYGVKLYYEGANKPIELWDINLEDKTVNGGDVRYIGEAVKPFLRSMSSMTEEEKNIYEYNRNSNVEVVKTALFDWLNEKMFDHRGLIEKGLALEAPEGMYC